MVDSAYELLLYNTLYLIRNSDPALTLEQTRFLMKSLCGGHCLDKTLSNRFEVLASAVCQAFEVEKQSLLNKMYQFNPEEIKIQYESDS